MTVTPRRGRRSRIPGAPATARVWAWLTPEEREALRLVAQESGQDIAVVIREAVNAYVGDYSDRRVFSVTGNSATR